MDRYYALESRLNIYMDKYYALDIKVSNEMA